jgi:uncharacterized repeat protein (TIGR03943 family)
MIRKTGSFIEGFILLALGGFMSALVNADNYWLYLHPKFKWLTLTAGMVLLVIGAIAVIFNRCPSLSRIIIFLLFTAVAGLGYALPNPVPSTLSGSLTRTLTAEEPRLLLKGQEYTKINIGELYNISERAIPEGLAGRYVTRGIVKRSPELDRLDQIAVFRTFLFCCFADAVAVGFRVEGNQLDQVHDGQWVKVYGTLQELPIGLPDPNVRVEGIFAKALNQAYAIAATGIKKIDPPEIPFMIELREAEPYAY